MKRLFILLLINILLFACNDKKDFLPTSGGKLGDVIVVIEKNVWNGEVGDALKNHLTCYYPSLPQNESTFSLYPVPLDNFNDVFQNNRNIVKITFNPNSDSSSIRIAHDKWAKPQLIMEITAKDIPSMSKFINANGKKIKDIIINEEINRLKEVYTKFKEKKIIKHLKNKFGIDIAIPKGYNLNLDTIHFVWISYETPYTSQGFIFYSFPYTDTSVFNITKMLSIRDSVLKKYIPGPLKGSYMTTEYNYVPVDKRFEFNGNFCYEIRGLWRVENDFMGGPFISRASVVKNKVVVSEAYVYAPKDKKKNYIWQMEAILNSQKNL